MKPIIAIVAATLLPTFVAAQQIPIVDPVSSPEVKLQILLDREEIRQVITNYGLAFDMQDWDLHRSVFTDEIQMDFTASLGGGLQTLSADDWVSAVKPFFANLEGTQHIAMPLTIQIDGDTAYVRSMLHARHHLPNSKGGPVQKMVGHYDNWLIRTDEGWKIAKMVQTITWNEGNWYIIEKAAGLSE
ncbi:nuclear transport factor 2 family protein [uncultured Tateyamaria sp.]|uniref:nuclear transport factor 2 family protein n=1 Tax=uncultured Tateyamaria sp. TaxID=455651 RepID=UPI00261684A5|nr:nuclear transport factor 2 family protein [uncultured Tateyamaria sp.]